ncbi:VOC family protein [Pseudomonas sp. MDMC216]|jgi:PhnB protein|uniref:PhnB protein n=2 Tax=Pseudomonadaceae TaxID=135621 RepID=A0A1H2LWR2_9PSED|nr:MULTISPECIES: VOC family protein [Pseudomonas]KJU77871.1 3-demethylubiquinone-9 3-methyltransferase [Pseudomonas oleovorans]MCW1936468.1 VOC family protein [Pseudomonas sp. MDMC_285]ERH47984.1 3-demethylubiquinone-9 3-methyltransferase [Pseudomonas chengduensis]KJU77873.1 3-demethylubiquinone-9 3-methyltransferase [Pseudomonas oleovorans]KQO41023.1 3-demethylubiquinone-9 3-methyltransferase [Pseudomonas sp. Leaf83]
MKMHAYLMFDGQCEAAFNRYAEVFGGKLEMMRYADSPEDMEVPAEYQQRVMHVCLTVGDQLLMASDNLPQYPYEGIKGCSVSLQVDNVPEAERLYEALSAGGSVQMELQATFWATRFAMLTDRFGVSWMINCMVDSQQG